MLQIVNPVPKETQPDSPLMVDLRTSVEAGTVALALAQADAALQCRPMPEKITDLHPGERRKYADAAILALRLVNRDAEVYAEQQAGDTAFAELEQFTKDHDLDWLEDSHPVNEGDALEMLVHRIARKAVNRFRGVLNGTYPGLSKHLADMQIRRIQDGAH